jgi:hypothetical protein
MSKRLLLPALAIATMVIACGRNEFAAQTVALDPPEIVPRGWHDANTLIVGHQGLMHHYDVNSRRLGQRLTDLNGSWVGVGNCFPSSSGEYNVEVGEWFTLNPLDCSRIDEEERAQKVAALKRDGRSVQSHRPLLLASHGNAFVTFVTVPIAGSEDASGRILHLYSSGADMTSRELPLPSATGARLGTWGSRPSVQSFQDSDGSYLIYETTSHFDADESYWPMTAWRLTPDLATVQVLTLPPGPWVVSHGLFKELSCFSCGCHCYANFYLTGAQGRIYAHVHGKSVDDHAAGIYELIQANGETAWVHRVKGNFDGPIVVSPDGCHIAYSDAVYPNPTAASVALVCQQ